MSMRTHLARTLAAKRLPAVSLTKEARERLIQQGFYQAQSDVDTMLRELMEPGEAVLAAGDRALPPRHDDESLAIWQAMLQHILNEPRDTKDDAA